MNSDPSRFADYGYVVIPQVFTAQEIAAFRAGVERHPDHAGDLLSHPALAALVADERLLTIARQLSLAPLRYFGDSSVSLGVGPYGFHRDNADRDDPTAFDWRFSTYPLVRMALYLQEYSRWGGGLEVRPRSHQACQGPHDPPLYLATSLGDLVVWNLRLYHTGQGGRHLPPSPEPRMALFLTYGSPGPACDHYIAYLKTRAYQVEIWRNSHYRREDLIQGSQRGLLIRDMRRDLQGVPGLGAHPGYVPLPSRT